MQKPVIILLMFFSLFVAVKAQDEKVKQIDSLMNAARQIGTFNGNVLVAQKGKIIYQSAIGYADGTKQKNLSLDLRFDIGSISKEFNSTAILMLQEQGKLKLDDKISTYLPFLPKWAETIKIKNLLQYTSGLPNTGANSDEELKNELLKLEKLEFEPGKAFIYSYSNVYLQRKIIEKTTTISYKDFVENKIFKPCRMPNATVDLPINNPKAARAFSNDFVNSTNTQLISGGVMLTANDLYEWNLCLHSYTIINEKSFKELAEGFSDSETSLGSTKFENNKLITHQHHGSNFNFEALMFTDSTADITVILLTNNQNFKVHALRDAIIAILNGRPYQVPKKSIYLDIREKILNNFEEGIAFYNHIKENKAEKYDLASEFYDLISTGKYLQRRAKYDEAISIFQLASSFEIKKNDLSYCFELIAESYLKKGSQQMAIIYYKKAVEKDETNKNAKGRLEEILAKKKD